MSEEEGRRRERMGGGGRREDERIYGRENNGVRIDEKRTWI